MAHKMKQAQEKRKSIAEEQKLEKLKSTDDKKKSPRFSVRSLSKKSSKGEGGRGHRAAQQGQKVPLTQWVDRTMTIRSLNGVKTDGMTCSEKLVAYAGVI